MMHLARRSLVGGELVQAQLSLIGSRQRRPVERLAAAEQHSERFLVDVFEGVPNILGLTIGHCVARKFHGYISSALGLMRSACLTVGNASHRQSLAMCPEISA